MASIPAVAALQAIHDDLIELLARTGQPLRRLRIQAGDTLVEVEWLPGAVAAEPGEEPSASQGATARAEGTSDDGTCQVRSPMVGTFHRRPAPDAEPFVQVGDAVAAGQQVGIVEAMKLMHPIESPCDGQVQEISAADGVPVQFDERLLVIKCETDGPDF